MLKKMYLAAILLLTAFGLSVFGQDKTVVSDAKAKAMLLGKHKLSLQWISWDYFGQVSITNKRGVLYLKGEQKQRRGSDYVKIDGVITSIDQKEFKFNGTITMQISHIADGKPCKRTGEMTFRITGKRKYWRLQEMDNPCDEATDYVDIYFR
ncbi:MAG: hypothetical protein M3Q99_16300 [Acidobacteriota bacterium]|nr:hypothetical protein [Acidobacteriota bacterium]